MREIVITGASGFVGKNLSQHLANIGFTVIPISLKNNQWREKIPSSTFAIIHLAGLAHDLKNKNKAEDYFKVNTELTKELFDLFNSSNISHFIYFSSVKAVTDTLGNEVLDEQHTANPKTPFGQSKKKSEDYILAHQKVEKKVYILRPCMIHGPNNKGNLNMLFNFVNKGIPFPLAAFDNKRSFLSIQNLNYIVQHLFTENIASGVYNVADSETLSTVEVVNIINECLGKKPRLWSLNKKNITFIAKLGSKLSLPFNTDRLNKLTESYQVSNEKILNALQKPLPVKATEGIKITINSIK